VRPGAPVGDGASSVVDGSVVGLGGELGNDVLGGAVLGSGVRVGALVVLGRLGTTATGAGE
jgi:hypothetical protein